MPEPVPATTSLSRYEARTAAAVFERLFPADEHGPGATAIGVLTYVDRALAGAYRDHADSYRLGLAALDRAARERTGRPFADADPAAQDALLADLHLVHDTHHCPHVRPTALVFTREELDKQFKRT